MEKNFERTSKSNHCPAEGRWTKEEEEEEEENRRTRHSSRKEGNICVRCRSACAWIGIFSPKRDLLCATSRRFLEFEDFVGLIGNLYGGEGVLVSICLRTFVFQEHGFGVVPS